MKNPVKPGGFPYPLTDGPHESRYLTWLRNHANYMAVRGMLDYLRSVGVLVRGIVVNFLTFLPCLLIVAVILSWAHFPILNHPFLMTQAALLASAVWILFFPLATPLFRILRYRTSLATGSESTVKQRDYYERSFGGMLLILLGVVLTDSLPWLLEFFRELLEHEQFGGTRLFAVVGGVLAFLSGSDKLLKVLKGVSRKIAMAVIGLLGLIVPLIVVLVVADFLVYDPPPSEWMLLSPLLLPAVGAVSILLVILFGLALRVLKIKEVAGALGMLFLAVGLLWIVHLGVRHSDESAQETSIEISELAQPLIHLTSRFDNLPDDVQGPQLKELIPQFVELDHALKRIHARQEQDLKTLKARKRDLTAEEFASEEAAIFAGFERTYFKVARDYLARGEQMKNVSADELSRLRAELARQARLKLFMQARAHLLKENEKEGQEPADDIHYLIQWESIAALTDVTFASRYDLYQDTTEGLKYRLAEIKDFKDDVARSQFDEVIQKMDEEALLEFVALLRKDPDKLRAKAEQKLGDDKTEADQESPSGRGLFSRNAASQLLREGLVTQLLEDHTRFPAETVKQHLRRQAILRALPPGNEALAMIWNDEESADDWEKQLLDAGVDQLELDEVTGRELALRVLRTFSVDRLAQVAAAEDEFPDFQPSYSAGSSRSAGSGNEKRLDAVKLRELAESSPFMNLAKVALVSDGQYDDSSSEFSGRRPVLSTEELIVRTVFARRALIGTGLDVAELARERLITIAMNIDRGGENAEQARLARETLAQLAEYDPEEEGFVFDRFKGATLTKLAVSGLHESRSTDELVRRMVFGKYGNLEPASLTGLQQRLFKVTFLSKALFVTLLAVVIWLLCWLTVDVNLTSIHGMYRDRLATAFLTGQDSKGDIDIEQDVDLFDICRYESRSIAPYHIVNVALNLQGSTDIGVRDRQSDFFIFSKRYIGGQRTGYCRSQTMEQVFPQVNLAAAMAISAAAASPNMGRGTSPTLVAFMTLLNIRLGYWLPNPGLVEETRRKLSWRERRALKKGTVPRGFCFEEVFADELEEIKRRWTQVYPNRQERTIDEDALHPTARHGLVGIAYSGGGIRSATINLGITQVLHQCGVFDHADFMSTVSGGGYLGSSISAIMRSRTRIFSEIAGSVTIRESSKEKIVKVTGNRLSRVDVANLPAAPGDPEHEEAVERHQLETREYRFSPFARLDVQDGENIAAGRSLIVRRMTVQSEVEGTVNVKVTHSGDQIVEVSPGPGVEPERYQFSRYEQLIVDTGDTVKAGQPLARSENSLSQRFLWRVRPSVFLREMRSLLDEKHWWVNLSDGGHIENLAAIELLRRRCRYIIIGDGEADPNMHFNGLATLIRTAQIDLGVEIDIDVDDLRLLPTEEGSEAPAFSRCHWALGTITYPEKDSRGRPETGYLLYLKSSFTDDEGEVICEYRNRHPDFPHQSTADQMFDEEQFEAYRMLGQHIAKSVVEHLPAPARRARKSTSRRKTADKDAAENGSRLSYANLRKWFETLSEKQAERVQPETE